MLAWELIQKDEVVNTYLIQFDGGWTEFEARGSQELHGMRETYVSLGSIKDDEGAQNLIRRASQGIAKAQVRAGTGEVRKKLYKQPDGALIGVPGAYPFVDFNVGDTVKGPGSGGRPARG